MVKVLPAIFSYEDMKSRFAQDNPDDPYTRRKDLESGIYELDSWLIRVDDDNKAISTVGFKEHPSHTVVGGMYASAKGREIGGNNRALQMAREPQLNQSKPLVAAFGHRDGDNARWMAKAKQNGWKFPEDSGFQQISQLLPEKVVSAWNSAYPNGNWAIRSIRGEGDFAKCVYLDDPMPTWFNILKSNQGAWKNILKWRPDGNYEDFKSYKTKNDGGKTSKIHRDVRKLPIIAGGHYIYRGLNRVREHERSLLNSAQLTEFGEKILSSGFPHKRGYFPIKEGSRLKILFNIVSNGEVLPQQRGITSTERLVTNNSGGDVVVFTTMFTTKKPANSHLFPMWETPNKNQLTVEEAEELFKEHGVTGFNNAHRVGMLKVALIQKNTDEKEVQKIIESLEDYANERAVTSKKDG